MAAWNSWKLLRDEFVKRLKFGVRIMAGQKSDLAGEAEAVRVDTGRLEVIEKLAVAGAAPSEVVGTPGRLNEDVTYEISAGNTVIFHPLQHGVSVSVATAAGESVAAVGRVVTFTDRNDDASTVATMRASLAASNAAGLVEILLGTAVVGDTWDHTLVLAETPLWASGTIPANLQCRMGSDGHVYPVSLVEGWQYRSAAAEACASILATPGTILRGMVYNQGGADAWLQFHDLAAAPGGGVAPALVIGVVAAGDTVPWPTEVRGSVGLQVALSSTRDTYTAYAFGHVNLWVE
jgi:hypothetical protein